MRATCPPTTHSVPEHARFGPGWSCSPHTNIVPKQTILFLDPALPKLSISHPTLFAPEVAHPLVEALESDGCFSNASAARHCRPSTLVTASTWAPLVCSVSWHRRSHLASLYVSANFAEKPPPRLQLPATGRRQRTLGQSVPLHEPPPRSSISAPLASTSPQMRKRPSEPSDDGLLASIDYNSTTNRHDQSVKTNSSRQATSRSPMSTERQRFPNGASRPHSNMNSHAGRGPGLGKVEGASLPLSQHQDEKSTGDVRIVATVPKSRQSWKQSVWAMSLLTFLVTSVGLALLYSIVSSAWTLHCDAKGCRMSYMRPSFIRFVGFDTEHTRLAGKYSLYLYREQGIDHDHAVSGIPVLFIPGNSGSYKQVRALAAESATYYHENLRHDQTLARAGVKNLDFFSVDFNEDFTAFHGQTLLEQAEYLNEAVGYILSLYSDPKTSRRDSALPDPTSVIIVGHSMGGVVARTMLTISNYQVGSVNTIITMSAPHARPPVTFDSQIVKIYADINAYWRRAYASPTTAATVANPLEDITLISIAGGGLDTVVPSDYCGLESLVPESHGFTVFTSSIPNVWTSMDHQAIMWCDQFRKVVTKALHEIVDNRDPSQTRSREERMNVFKKWFLTGMESISEKSARTSGQKAVLTLNEDFSSSIVHEQHIALRDLGSGKSALRLLPIPPLDSSASKTFTLLTNSQLGQPGTTDSLKVLLCSLLPIQPSDTDDTFTATIDMSQPGHGSSRLSCQDVVPDVIPLPASTQHTHLPFSRDGEEQLSPLSYLEYSLEDIASYGFIAILDQGGSPAPLWLLAEFNDAARSHLVDDINLRDLLTTGLEISLPADRPMVTDLRIRAMQSSLLAYNLVLNQEACSSAHENFRPLMRHYLSGPYESKYFVNMEQAEVSLYGISPYVPPSSPEKPTHEGTGFQFWTDPTCRTNATIRISVDPMASVGKLYMRYRTVFAAFPLLVVAMVLRKQFLVYSSTGQFISFSKGIEMCLKRSLPLLVLSLTCLSLSIGHPRMPYALLSYLNDHDSAYAEFAQNDLLTGTSDPIFCFLVPMIAVVCVGVCVAVHYFVLVLVYMFSSAYGFFVARPAWSPNNDNQAPQKFTSSTRGRRLATTIALLLLVSTTVPYQFAFVVACLVQLSTNVRAFWHARDISSTQNTNFSNYAHSIFLLMFWILPVNLPTLVVWIRNLAVHWFMPFSSHHNVLSILPFILLVETLTTGQMIPRVMNPARHCTDTMLFGVSVFAAIYGVSYAYMLHQLVNLIAAWFVALHVTGGSWPPRRQASIIKSGSVSTSPSFTLEGGAPSNEKGHQAT